MSHPADSSADSLPENTADSAKLPSTQTDDNEPRISNEWTSDEWASEEWIPDEWIPNERTADKRASDKPAADKRAADKRAASEQVSDNARSQPLTSLPSKSADQKTAATPIQTSDPTSAQASTPTPAPTSAPKHSAELFPVPPVAAANSGTSTSSSSPTGASTTGAAFPAANSAVGPLPLVETAFLASAASLMWLINSYFPPGPLLRILFPLPIALIYLRWNLRSAWMAATVSGLLLTILLGPTRSIFFVMPYGFLGVQLGYFWRRNASWELSMSTGALLVSLGTFFRIWLLSLLSGEDLWGYLVAQITQFLDWLVRLLTNWGWVGLGTWGQPSMEFIAIAAVVTVLLSSLVYLLTVHIAAWLVLERLRVPMPEPPGWLQALLEE